ncbi:MFS transporter [Rhodococcus artemisiae]|uniref:MFS transporter n=1 Tax=Rhodococcus artemisiae TaxID=714159 RepID=A0ABU7LIM5_9NOCA|nr:MFS transporter [Rhodococcus artemisiae]MEE2061361.1 MFS transporter [Rhodococcus artemisiae]
MTSLTNFLIAMVFYLLVTAMALYAVDRFMASDAESGLAVSAFVIGSVVTRLFTGQAMDLVGRRRTLIVALVVFLGVSAAYMVAGSLWLLIAVRFVHGLAFGAANTTLAASVIGLIPRGRLSEGTGWFGTSTTVATAIGPLLALQLTDIFGYDSLFITCTVFAVAALVVGSIVRLPEAPGHRSARRFSMREMVSTKVIPISAVILIGGLAYSSVLAFLNGYAQEEDLNPAVPSVFFLVYAAVLLASRFFAGPLQDRYGDNAVVCPLIVCFAVGLAVLSLWSAPGGFVTAAILCALGFGALMTSLQSVAVSIVPREKVGTATSTFFLMLDAGVGVGPIVLGALLPATGYSGMYLVLSGVMVALLVFYWLVHGRKSRPDSGVPLPGRGEHLAVATGAQPPR